MSLTLLYTDPKTNKTVTLFNYNPSDKQWWITGFDPKYQNINASDLTAIYTVTFNNQTMYNDFLKSQDYLNNKNMWQIIDDKKWIMQLTFDNEPKITPAVVYG